jgi:hypothetical protein
MIKKMLAACILLAVIVGMVGCGPKSASSQEAIEAAKSMETVEEKVSFLMAEANAFYSSKEFQQAIDIAQHVLRYLDSDSQEAKNLIEKAKQALTEAAQGAVDDVTSKLGDLGK